MKLAEALLLRNEIQTKLTSLTSRITANAVVQQGDEPQEDPLALIAQAQDLLGERQALVERINATNQVAQLDERRTIAQAIAERDRLTKLHGIIHAALSAARGNGLVAAARYSLSEIKWVTAIDVKQMQSRLDDLARQIREINAAIQQVNWDIELA